MTFQPIFTLDSAIENGSDTKISPLNETIQTDVWLTLNTKIAQLLVRGRTAKNKPPIIGLIRFADVLRLIWNAAKRNDPYADWWLIKIEDELATLEHNIKQSQDRMRARIRSTPAYRVVPPVNKEAFRIRLQFATPFAFQAARLLANFDVFVCENLVGKHIGVLARDEANQSIYTYSSKIRGLFALATRFRHLDINRSQPHTLELVAHSAIRYMGHLPKDIKAGTRRARLAPPINEQTSTYVPPVENDLPELEDLNT